jgi:hypothetical protein
LCRYPWAAPLAEGGPGPALLGLRPEGRRDGTAGRDRQPVAAPAGVGEPGEDVAGAVKRRVQQATQAVAQRPVGGAPNKPHENVFVPAPGC